MLAKRMGTIMKFYRFDDNDPVTTLTFLEQFKRARDSNGVLEDKERKTPHVAM